MLATISSWLTRGVLLPLQSSDYCGQDELVDYLNFSTSPQAPVKVVTCSFAQGSGMGLVLFSMFFFGGIGLALMIRVRHPAPIVVAAMLTIGVAAASLPGQVVRIAALILFFAVAGLGIYLYQRAQTSL